MKYPNFEMVCCLKEMIATSLVNMVNVDRVCFCYSGFLVDLT